MSNLHDNSDEIATYRNERVPEGIEGEDVDELREDEVEEHLGQLTVRKRQGPKTQVGSSVGHGTKHEFDGMDHRVDKGVAEGVITLRDAHVAHLLVKLGDVTLQFCISLLNFTAHMHHVVFIIFFAILTVLFSVFVIRLVDRSIVVSLGQLNVVVLRAMVRLGAENSTRYGKEHDGDANNDEDEQHEHEIVELADVAEGRVVTDFLLLRLGACTGREHCSDHDGND